jgi:hypothetical protein
MAQMKNPPTLVSFADALAEDDWGLIIGKDGELKGMFIPEGKDDEDVPDAIVDICVTVFGIDPTEEVTLH